MAEFAKPGYVTINAVPVLFSLSIDGEHDANDNAVLTTVLGLAGHSDGAARTRFTVQNAVPQSAYEFDAEAFTQSHTTLVLGFKIGTGRERKYRGRILSARVTTAPDRPTEQTFTFEGARVS